MAANVSADDYRAWGLLLRSLWDRTDVDFQGHIDPEDEAALVLVELLERDQVAKLSYALLEHSPGLTQRFSDELMAALVEELARRGQEDAAKAVLEVNAHWRQED